MPFSSCFLLLALLVLSSGEELQGPGEEDAVATGKQAEPERTHINILLNLYTTLRHILGLVMCLVHLTPWTSGRVACAWLLWTIF